MGFATLLFALVGLMAQLAADGAGMTQYVCWNSTTALIDPNTGEDLPADEIGESGECVASVDGGNR